MRAWELYVDAVGVPGCATGCNIEIHRARGRVYRLVPRDNAAVNKYWMCDEGRFTYKAIARRAPRRAAHRRRATTDWDRALEAAGKKLRRRSTPTPARSASCFIGAEPPTRTTTCSSAWRSSTCASARRTWPGRDQGWPTTSCVSADMNPNTAGAIAIGAGRLKSLMDLANDSALGRGHGAAGARRPTACSSARARRPRCRSTARARWSVIGTHTDLLVDAAHVRAAAGGVGRGRRHVHQPPGHGAADPRGAAARGRRAAAAGRSSRTSRGGWASTLDFSTPKAVFTEAKQKLAFMKDAEWGRAMLPVQLRFAGSRG